MPKFEVKPAGDPTVPSVPSAASVRFALEPDQADVNVNKRQKDGMCMSLLSLLKTCQ